MGKFRRIEKSDKFVAFAIHQNDYNSETLRPST